MGGTRAAVGGAVVMLLVACGGGSDTPSKAAWTEKHGPALDALDADLQAARTTLSSLQRPDILGTCGALRDSLGEASKGLPVPDQQSNSALRSELDMISLHIHHC